MSWENNRDHQSLSRRLLDAFRLDPLLVFLLLLLSGAGMLILYSASGGDLDRVLRQGMRLGLAWLLLLVMANLPLRLLKKLSLGFYLGVVGLLLAVMLFGEIGKGAQRWLDLGFIRFQPSELMKLAMPMMLASYLSDKVLP
ncbi:MAG TPA: rod shape-determining protein RodA, partial [Gammaproteobacteria bacterium]|nr:rod shape-determining protein RodA [Gammaproteobacteria bacterium]